MALNKIEHLGIAVKNLQLSDALFTKLLGREPYKHEEVASEHVLTSFFMQGPNKIELLQATSPESAIAKFIEKKGEGLHHVAFDVDDIHAEIERLKAEGFTILNPVPKKGADNKLICFVHPKDTNGVLIELCQEIK
jgi:methylmalonyl-CoA/ethylmalonyl-CoA epimerase